MKNMKNRLAAFAAALSAVILLASAPAFSAAPGLSDPDASARAKAATDIGNRRDKAGVPDLINIIKTEKDVNVIGAAVRALGMLGDPRADQPLLDLYAKQSNQSLKNIILLNIGYINDPAVVPDLIKIIDREPAQGPRIRAVVMLSGFPASKVTRDKLEGLANNENEDVTVRQVAVEALTRLVDKQDPESTKALKRIQAGARNDKFKKYTDKRMKDKGLSQ